MFILGYLLIAVGKVLSLIVNLYMILIIVDTVVAWFHLSSQNRLIQMISTVVSPFLNQLRGWLPSLQIDIAPLVAIFVLYFFDAFIVKVILRLGNLLI